MTTDKQKQANIQNATLGGVKTSEGKNITKYNALKHGVFTIAISEYEDGFHKGVFEDLVNQLHPIGVLETMVVERMALCCLRLYRVAKAENEFMKAKLHPLHVKKNNPVVSDFEKLAKEVEQSETEGYEPKISTESVKELEQILLRYDTTIENKLYKALHELQRLQAIRLGRPVTLPTAIDVSIDKNFDE